MAPTGVLVLVIFLASAAAGPISNVSTLIGGWDQTSKVSASDLLYVFDRPAEPIFTLRGVNRDVAFDIPASYLPERYKKAAQHIAKNARQNGVRLIPVPEVEMPFKEHEDVNGLLKYREKYSRAADVHLQLSVRFDHFFKTSPTNDILLARAIWARLHFNPEMVLDAFRTTLERRPGEQQAVQNPEYPTYISDMYVDDQFLAKAHEEMFTVPEGDRVVIPVIRNETSKGTPESKTWYWREDTHVNVFHMRWHMVFPPGFDDDAEVDKDRRGELFVYFHRQMLARYNAENFGNGVQRTQPLDIKKPVEEAFFPKLTMIHLRKGYPGRQAHTSLLPQVDSQQKIDLWTERYRKALRQGYVILPDNKKLELEGIKGLDIVANLIEANSLLSPNFDYYGTIHNQLHDIMGSAHDPLQDQLEPTSTMAILPTVRDHGFFRLHTHVDNLFEEYKVKLAPYTREQLEWPGVTVKSVSVYSDASRTTNELHTFWQETDLDFSRGLDYTPPGRIYGRLKHIQHEPFRYNIDILNENYAEKRAYVRVFLLMVTDEKGQPLDANSQRRFSIEMDRFDATLHPGMNKVTRESRVSALSYDQDAIYTKQKNWWDVRRVNQCRCGWPQTLLVPRGTKEGMPFKLFVMVTDYTEDKPPSSPGEICRDGWLLCGVPGSKFYPDKKPMGFPFDRPYRTDCHNLNDLLEDNMAAEDIVVKFHDDKVVPPSALLPGGVSTSWMP